MLKSNLSIDEFLKVNQKIEEIDVHSIHYRLKFKIFNPY